MTSGGASAGAATNSKAVLLVDLIDKINTIEMEIQVDTHPTSFLASQRKGFSKL